MKKNTDMLEIQTGHGLNIVWKMRHVFIAGLLLCAAPCTFAAQTKVPQVAQASPNGAAGQMPAFYDGELFTVNVFEVPASDRLIAQNQNLNIIYASNDLDEEQDFDPVIDAIQGDGFNPLWLQVLIVFNDGFTPHQFFSDEEIELAAAGANPEITLIFTDEVYRCSVVGSH
jgi:hypothetical protein